MESSIALRVRETINYFLYPCMLSQGSIEELISKKKAKITKLQKEIDALKNILKQMNYNVGKIQNYDVIYVPERNQIFCKNTAINYSLIERIIRGSTMRETIPEKDLTITKDMGTVTLGCLTTTMENCLAIRRQVNKLKFKD